MERKERYLGKEDEFPEHLKIAESDLKLGRVIGRGSSSEVCRAHWLGCEVTVKQIHLHQDFQFRTWKSHALEQEILMSLPHPHVVQLLGYHADPRVVSIVMEYMETTLAEVIADRMRVSSRPFAPQEALDIMTKIAQGMRFLHSRRITHGCLSTGTVLMNVHPQSKSRFSSAAPFSDVEVWELCHKIALGMNLLHSKHVVHRDIKAANVLVHDRHGRFDVKLADFGVSHRIGNPNVAGCAGTGLWRAPEVLKRESLTEEKLKKKDVYSYAMTCYEIMTGSFPLEGEVVDASSRPVRMHVHKEDVILGCRLKLPDGLNPDLGKLISDCWQDDPSERPDFATICDVFAINPLRNVALPQSRAATLFEF